jgi:hypothetical protein
MEQLLERARFARWMAMFADEMSNDALRAFPDHLKAPLYDTVTDYWYSTVQYSTPNFIVELQ